MNDLRKKIQDSLDENVETALANGADGIELSMAMAVNQGELAKKAIKTALKSASVSEAEAAKFADDQYLTDEMERSGISFLREAYQDKDVLSPEEAENLKLRLIAEAGWSPEIAERVVTMPRMKIMAKNVNEVQAGLDEWTEIRKAITDSNGDIQGTELWVKLPEERQTLVLGMQEQMARKVEIDEMTQIRLYGALKSRRDADAGAFYQQMNTDSQIMAASVLFHNKPEMLRSLLSGQPLDPAKIPPSTALAMEAGELMAGENPLGKQISGRITNSVNAFMPGTKKEERDSAGAELKTAIIGDLVNAARTHKTSIENLAPLEREKIINDGLLRYQRPGFLGYKDPVYGQKLSTGEKSDSRLDPSSLSANERLNLTTPNGIVSSAPSALPEDAGAMVRVQTNVDLLQTPTPVQGRIRHDYGLRDDLSITQQLDKGIFVVIPPAGKGMIVARDGSVVHEIPASVVQTAQESIDIPDDLRTMISDRARAVNDPSLVHGYPSIYNGGTEYTVGTNEPALSISARVSGRPTTPEEQ